MKRISIVTPSYNQARFLEQTIRSVLDQEIPGTDSRDPSSSPSYSLLPTPHSLPPTPSIEYFVIDGNSTDGSAAIIQKYASSLTGWVSEKDQGQADAINKGLRQAQGEIVAWLNSDDFYLPGAIQRALRAFDENPQAGLVYGNVLSVDAESKAFNLQTFASFDLLDLMSFRIISQPAVFIRRSVLEQAGLLDPSYHCLLDHHLWLRMARLAPMVYIPETLAAARYHADAKNVARPAEFGREAFRLVEWMKSSIEFAELFAQHKSRILAGAERFDAFYLLDGGQYHQALAAYERAWHHSPAIVLKEAHRVAYAALSLAFPAPLAGLRSAYSRLRSAQRQDRTHHPKP
jgi:glycosyltransferase involved in cell wall biosynthesis